MICHLNSCSLIQYKDIQLVWPYLSRIRVAISKFQRDAVARPEWLLAFEKYPHTYMYPKQIRSDVLKQIEQFIRFYLVGLTYFHCFAKCFLSPPRQVTRESAPPPFPFSLQVPHWRPTYLLHLTLSPSSNVWRNWVVILCQVLISPGFGVGIRAV